jgi:hypothetical protein
MARTRQGGSVLGFAVAAVVMAGFLIGSIYVIRKLTVQPDIHQPQPPIAQSQQSKPPQKSSQQQTGSNSGSGQPPQVATTSPPAPTAGQTGQLPHTGPSGILGSIIALSLISGAAVSYVRSRRPELSL